MSRVIFWDFDGTLAFRENGWTGALREVLAQHEPDLGVTIEQVRPFLQTGFPWHEPEKPHLHFNHDPDAWWRALIPIFMGAFRGLGLATERAEILALGVRAQYLSPRAWRRYDDALPVVQALAERGWRQVIVSNHVPELAEIVSMLGLGNLFEMIVNSASFGYEKPHPAIYEQALKVSGPAEAFWMVGDSYSADVLGAQTAHIPAILVRKTHPEARYVCPDLTGVPAIIAQH